MKLLMWVVHLAGVCFFFLIPLVSSESVEESTEHNKFYYPSVTKYYAKILTDFLNNTNISDDNVLESLATVLNHSVACGNLFKILVKKKSLANITNEYYAKRFDSFLRSMRMINDEHKIIVDKIKNKIYGVNNVDIEMEVLSTLILLGDVHNPVIAKYQHQLLNVTELLNFMAEFIEKTSKNAEVNCKPESLSMHQLLSSVYNCISLTVFNGYSMIFNAYKTLSKVYQESSLDMIISKRSELKTMILLIANQSGKALMKVSQHIRRCDPTTYEEGINFGQLRYVIQAHVMGRNNLIDPLKKSSGACSEVISHSPPITFNNYRFQCLGHFHNCWNSEVREICLSENPKAGRIYQAFKGTNGKVFGPWNQNCVDKNIFNYTLVSEEKQVTWGNSHGIDFSTKSDYEPQVCACECDDYKNPNTVRRFSLKQVISKNTQGVVTGIKLDIDQGEVSLKIRVGILVNGVVDRNQQSWDSKHVEILNHNGSLWKRIEDSKRESNQTNDNQKKYSQDYVFIHYQWRNVIVDDFRAPAGTFVQGVKFAACHDGIAIDLLATKFDENNQLLPETAKWYTKCNYSIKREEIEIPKNPNIPTMSNLPNIVTNKKNAFVKFQTTGWLADASQTTIPFLDTQEIVTNPPVPLEGIGIYYKTQPKYGGFIGIQLLTFDFSQYMTPNIISKDMEKLMNVSRESFIPS